MRIDAPILLTSIYFPPKPALLIEPESINFARVAYVTTGPTFWRLVPLTALKHVRIVPDQHSEEGDSWFLPDLTF